LINDGKKVYRYPSRTQVPHSLAARFPFILFLSAMFKPKFFSILPELTAEQIGRDVVAGILVGIVALPLAIAFAIASGVSPEKGLITAVIGGFLISFLGGSRVQIGGPTGAFIVILYGIVQQYGINGLMMATMMAGVILMMMGFAQFGSLIKFIPYPVIVGFTSGIAVIIFPLKSKTCSGSKLPQYRPISLKNGASMPAASPPSIL